MIILVAVVAIVVIAAGGYYFATSYSHATKSAITYTTTTAQQYTTSAAASTVASTTVAAGGSSTTANATTSVAATNTVNSSTSASFTVQIMSSSSVGNYLANASGFTLYYYNKDTPNSGVSECYASCATNWPPFYSATLTLPAGLNASSFATINRTGGTKQLTYDGYPLYKFIGDSKSGDITGNGVASFYVQAVK